jgi:hypothetical protein
VHVKNVRTDDLIVQLAARATPVTPLRPPAVRLVWWTIWAVAIAALAVIAVGARKDVASALESPSYALSLGLLAITMIGAAAAALASSVPGGGQSWIVRALPVSAAVAWPLLWIAAMTGGFGAIPPASARGPFHWACAIEIAVIAAAGGAVLLVMVRRAMPLRPAWTAAVVGLAAIGGASAATQIICPLSNPVHQFVGHVLPAVMVGAALVALGWRALAARLSRT